MQLCGKTNHMKKHLLTLAICLTSLIAFAQSPNDISIINAQDSVVFDLSLASEASGYVEFPIKFLSDDTVNAVDFSLKYDTTAFTYDTIIKLASYLSITSNLAADKTVYFTSFSIPRITNDTPLVKIRFTVLSGQFCSSALNTVMGYLNGDGCSVKIVDCIPNGIQDAKNGTNAVAIYPNPSLGLFHLSFNNNKSEAYKLFVSDINGRKVYERTGMSATGVNEVNLDLEFLPKGIYQVQLITPSINLNRKIVLR